MFGSRLDATVVADRLPLESSVDETIAGGRIVTVPLVIGVSNDHSMTPPDADEPKLWLIVG